MFATVVVLLGFIEERRQTFARGLTFFAVVISLIGIWLFFQTVDAKLYRLVGDEVIDLYLIRNTSVFPNPTRMVSS